MTRGYQTPHKSRKTIRKKPAATQMKAETYHRHFTTHGW